MATTEGLREEPSAPRPTQPKSQSKASLEVTTQKEPMMSDTPLTPPAEVPPPSTQPPPPPTEAPPPPTEAPLPSTEDPPLSTVPLAQTEIPLWEDLGEKGSQTSPLPSSQRSSPLPPRSTSGRKLQLDMLAASYPGLPPIGQSDVQEETSGGVKLPSNREAEAVSEGEGPLWAAVEEANKERGSQGMGTVTIAEGSLPGG